MLLYTRARLWLWVAGVTGLISDFWLGVSKIAAERGTTLTREIAAKEWTEP